MTKDDWERVQREVIERGRSSVGDPPSPETLVAYREGRLSKSEEERVAELLAYYPDLVRILLESDDDDAARVLDDKTIEADWKRLQAKLTTGDKSQVVPFPPRPERGWRWATAAASAAAVLFGFLYLRSVMMIDRPHENVERVVLLEGVSRGPASARPVTLATSTRYLLISLTLADEVAASQFRVALTDLDSAPPRVVWTGTVVRGDDGTFSFEVPRQFLHSHSYGIRLYRDDPTRTIASYALWIAPDSRDR